MERLLNIKKEIQEKNGREFIGLQTKTEQLLNSLTWYLDHPKIHEDTRLAEEIIELYYLAKASGFLKMEALSRKLDQLGVKISRDEAIQKISSKPKIPGSSQKKIQFLNVGQSIIELKQRIQDFLSSRTGKSLPDASLQSVTQFLNYLDHPDLPNRAQLFEDMLEKYNSAENAGFIAMQAFNDMLTKAEIKLGKIEVEIKEKKSPEQIKEELEAEKAQIAEEWKKIEEEKQKLKEEWDKLEAEKKKFQADE